MAEPLRVAATELDEITTRVAGFTSFLVADHAGILQHATRVRACRTGQSVLLGNDTFAQRITGTRDVAAGINSICASHQRFSCEAATALAVRASGGLR